MRKALIGLTPLALSLAALAQTTPAAKPAVPAGSPAGMGAQSAEVTPPAHPITDAQVKELMALTGTDKIKEQLIENAAAYFKRSFPPYIPADVMTDMNKSLSATDINTPVVAIYKKYLSTEDATKIIEFYRTPAGHDLIKATPPMLTEAQRTAMQTMQTAARDVMERHKTEIEAAQKTYQAQHSAPTLGPSGGAASPSSTTTPKPSATPTTPH